MTETDEQKMCGMCGMEIPGVARKCPYCHVFHTRLSMIVHHPLFTMSLGLVFFGALMSFYVVMMNRLLDRGEDFQRYAHQISVHDVRIGFGQLEDQPTVAVLGRLKNSSEIGWKNVRLLAEFHDSEGNLIDVEEHSSYSYGVPPSGDVGFKISTAREFPEDSYDTANVVVISADDARSRW